MQLNSEAIATPSLEETLSTSPDPRTRWAWRARRDFSYFCRVGLAASESELLDARFLQAAEILWALVQGNTSWVDLAESPLLELLLELSHREAFLWLFQ